MIALESLIRPDTISSEQSLLACTFPNDGIHDRLGNHRCCSELDFCKALLQGFPSFYLVQGQGAYEASRPGWCVWWFQGLRQDPGMSRKVVLRGPSPSSCQQCFLPVLCTLPSPGSAYKFWANLIFPWHRLKSDLTLS